MRRTTGRFYAKAVMAGNVEPIENNRTEVCKSPYWDTKKGG